MPRAALLALGMCLVPMTSSSQVVLDGKFGSSGALSGPNYDISADLGATRGNNLFHSFSQFDLKAGDVATFSGPANIQNILSRVTGGASSSIDGTIRSGIAGANFYFINPKGVVFGPGASVDVSGAFAVSTANYLKLADDAKFVAAIDADDSLLSSAPVAAFGFLDGARGNVEVSGSVRSGVGTSLSVIGSTVSVSDGASLESIGGQINLTGVSGPGEVASPAAVPITGGPPSQGPGDATPGTIVIRGGRLVVENATISANTGGGVDLQLSDSVEIRNGGQVTTQSPGASKGGDIVIESPSVRVDGQDGLAPTRVAAETASGNRAGAGGDIIVRSDSLEVLRGAEVSVSTYGAADAGTVDITTGSLQVEGSDSPYIPTTQISANAAPVSGIAFGAGGHIVIHADSVEAGKFAVISASTLGDANAGSIDIAANSIAINDSSVTTYSTGIGNGGDIHIEANDLTLDGMFGSITAFTLGLNSYRPAGKGGLIDINAGTLTLLNDSAIAAGTYGDGNGGNVNITADSVVLDTGHPQPGIFPGISASSGLSFDGFENRGSGGDITLQAGTLSVRNGMLISATTATPGTGGNIRIQAGQVSLENNSSIQAASEGTGPAGTISINSSGSIGLADNSSVSTSAPQSSGGNIQVSAGDDIQLTESQFSARAGPAGGGNIEVESPQTVYLLNSAFDAQAVGNGGNLTISPPVFFVINNSGLISKSASENGGNITILSDYFFQSGSIIDASAPFGLPGTVTVSAPNVDLSGILIALPGNLLGAETQLRPDCAVRFSENVSSFIVLGRGGLPLEPEGFVPSLLAPTENEKH